MDPLIIVLLIASAAWFFVAGAIAKKGIWPRIVLSISGAVSFIYLVQIIETIVEKQQFYLRAVRSEPSDYADRMYITLPSAIVIFLIGLLIMLIISPKSPLLRWFRGRKEKP